METLIVGFSKPKSQLAIFAHLIRIFEGFTPYSHVYVRLYSNSLKRWLIYEAKGTGVNFTSPIAFDESVVVVKEFKISITPEQKINILQYCVDSARDHYGYFQVLGVALVRIIKAFGINIGNPFKKGTVCSELAAKILQKIGLIVPGDLDLVGPKDVFKFLEAKNG